MKTHANPSTGQYLTGKHWDRISEKLFQAKGRFVDLTWETRHAITLTNGFLHDRDAAACKELYDLAAKPFGGKEPVQVQRQQRCAEILDKATVALVDAEIFVPTATRWDAPTEEEEVEADAN